MTSISNKPRAPEPFDFVDSFSDYLDFILHSWLKILTILGFTLVPIFFILDIFIIPSEAKYLLPKFAAYRVTATAIVILQYVLIRKTKPSKFSLLHGYAFTFFVSLAIILMTVDLGGFNSSYYAGLNLVIIAVNLLLPWRAIHSALNGFITVVFYVIFNAIWGKDFYIYNLVNNLYFMLSTVVIAASINHVKYVLIQKEFESRKSLKEARDALWSEMEVAKRIQTSLTPPDDKLGGYEISAIMLPATEVGGDYYDIIRTNKNPWVMIGDVSGHGVESGLIMMMAQTSVRTIISKNAEEKPSQVLVELNKVIKENIALLKVERYMTITAISLSNEGMTYAGSHQDIIVYRNKTKTIETFPTYGTWVGMLDDVEVFMQNHTLKLESGDLALLFTDGITELDYQGKEMFGQERLKESLLKYNQLSGREIIQKIVEEALSTAKSQDDDISLVLLKKV
ncbi:MAG TPA: SpoIIE family protein phosphatase [Leptospiraceae bacterium]|nr:SpoIIE family protein phosphatase [Leptospiraceae bacterium]HMW08294.1 SpoIIE family protein phosphatase [Leptospiraceae bacterium]HMX33131.1 SpoIIE family protein phosphatase [Leptospiraceae bacterium]HMY34012.1 SpoIIE family protein phosphatase [Leptospiraceae bacterium]HMZ63080.1 SpoIIE family protein phosphatase [Leptospiraceae bacterium]